MGTDLEAPGQRLSPLAPPKPRPPPSQYTNPVDQMHQSKLAGLAGPLLSNVRPLPPHPTPEL